MYNVLTLADAASVAETAVEIFVATATAAVETRGRFVVVLAGGSTPRTLYELLARAEHGSRVPWDRTWVLFGDERCVPPEDGDSNYGMVQRTLLSRVAVPPEQVLRMQGELPHASRAAHFYEESLRELYPDAAWPRFDLVLLGIGADGHTASLFPGHDALHEDSRWVTAAYLSERGTWRLTLTLPALRAARQILFLATGEAKAEPVAQAFGGMPHDIALPAELVVPTDGSREVLVDRAAAAMLPPAG